MSATNGRPSDDSAPVTFALLAILAGVLGVILVSAAVWRTISVGLGVGTIEILATGDLPGADASIASAVVESSQVGETSRAFLIGGSIANALVTAATYGAIVVFFVLAAKGTPFHRLLFRAAITAGLVMTLGGFIAAALSGIGRVAAADFLGAAPDGPFLAAFSIPPDAWAFGIVVLVAAYVIRVGQGLQRETEGLV